jgi:hypothetical protein
MFKQRVVTKLIYESLRDMIDKPCYLSNLIYLNLLSHSKSDKLN